VTDVAVVGTGAMGSRIARRLLDAGHRVVVWNRTPEKLTSLVNAGALPARTPEQAARAAEVVLTMVAGPAAIQAVSEGRGGIAAGIGDATLIEMSTVGTTAVKRLARALPPEAQLLDAPVLGSLAEAEKGTLRIFVGGESSVFERWWRLLALLGTPVHVGESGSGAAAKLVANGALFGTLALLGEGLALAEALGMSREAAYRVLGETPLAAQVERRAPLIDSGLYPRCFALSLAHKDADLIFESASERGIDIPLLYAAREWLARADHAGRGRQDYTALIAQILAAGAAAQR
jgi:3-hydroxyisobutyrate dehydrogenase-like beta-hydroxyacid dehydrogenase